MECNLGQGDLLRLEGRTEGIVLRSLKGTVWLTKGDGVDYLVHEGCSCRLRAGETAVVEAIGSAEIRLEAVASEAVKVGPILSLVSCRG